MQPQILIVDDEQGIRETLSAILEDEGYQVRSVESAAAARGALAGNKFDLVLLDVWLPDQDGLVLLEQGTANDDSDTRNSEHRSLDTEGQRNAPSTVDVLFDMPVIVISGHGTIDTAVKAIRIGAYDFLEKPLSLSRVTLTVANALEHGRLQREVQSLTSQLDDVDSLVGASDVMQSLASKIDLVAESDSRVLITGENGSGKEVVARRIWSRSKRSDRPFVAVNCAAIPQDLIESELFGHAKGAFTGATHDRRGRFEQAHQGTLFLDEIADMSLMTQAKVLRILEEQKFEPVGGTNTIDVDVRVLAATNKDLESEIAEGRFREDLFFRLNVIPVRVPPLRERPADVLPLFEHFVSHYAAELGKQPKALSADAERQLNSYTWPGNVRELRNLVERLMILAPQASIGVNDLPQNLRSAHSARHSALASQDYESLKEAREAFEATYIERLLREEGGNVTQTAKRLGVERSSLHRKLKSYGIDSSRLSTTKPH